MCSIAAKLQQQVDKADCMTESDCSGDEESGGDKFAIQSESHAVAKHMRTEMKNVAKKHEKSSRRQVNWQTLKTMNQK